MSASVQKSGRFGCHGDDKLDEFLLNQVAKFVKYGQLGPLSRDLRISQTDYEKITAPNTFPQNDQIFRVSILLSILSFILRNMLTLFVFACSVRMPLIAVVVTTNETACQ